VTSHLLLARRPASPPVDAADPPQASVGAEPISVPELRSLRHATGTTVTDIVMAAVAGTLRRWMAEHGDAGGHDQSLLLAGHRITRMWAWAPMSGDQSISTSIIGSDGQVHVEFKVDAAAVHEPRELVTGLRAELEELRVLAAATAAP
jgi:hypothetical protein